MAMKSAIEPGKGTLIRGADGALYFISNDKMRAFRLPTKKAARAGVELKRWSRSGKKSRIVACPATSHETWSIDIPARRSGRRK